MVNQGILLFRAAAVVLGLATLAIALFYRSTVPDPMNEPAISSQDRSESNRTALIFLTALIAAALVLRLIGLNSDLWYDEVVTLIDYVRLPLSQLVVTYTTPNNHILFSVFGKLSTNLFGEHPWALRLPALIAGIASLGALYWVGLKFVTPGIALLSTALVAVSYHHIWFSQNARGYTGLLLLTLLGTGLFLDGLRKRDPGVWLAYALVLALALYTHLTAVFPFMGHGLIYVALFVCHHIGGQYPKLRSLASPYPGAADVWPLAGFAFGLLIALQLYAIMIPQMVQEFASRSVQVSGPNKVAEWTNPVWTALEVVKSLGLSPSAIIALSFGGILSAVGFLDFLRRIPVIALLLVLNIPITLLVLLLIKFHIWPRYFFVNIGFFALILVNGAFVIGTFLDRHYGFTARFRTDDRRIGVAITLIVIAASLFALPKNYRTPKQDFSGARDFVEAARNPQDQVLTAGITTYPYAKLYAPSWGSITTVSELISEQKNGARTWIVFSFPTYMKGVYPELLEYIEKNFDLEKEFPGSLGDGTIYVWKSRN